LAYVSPLAKLLEYPRCMQRAVEHLPPPCPISEEKQMSRRLC
jgi:hypothetical protein